jgi:hypothetical protein
MPNMVDIDTKLLSLLNQGQQPPRPPQQQQPQQAGQSAKSPLGQLVGLLQKIMEETKNKQQRSIAGAPPLQKIGQYVKYATLIRLREELTKMRGMEKRASARNEIDRLIRKIDYGVRIVRRRIIG